MKTLTVLVGAISLSAMGCHTLDPLEPTPSAPLINLTDWHTVGSVNWSITEHAAEPVETNADQELSGYLVSPIKYSNFKLTIEFYVADDTNSGIFFRCINNQEISPINCYEANIWDNHPNQDFRTGALVTVAKPLSAVHTIGKWNHYEILAIDQRIEVTINGTKTIDLIDTRHTDGYIALQYAGNKQLALRNLRITGL